MLVAAVFLWGVFDFIPDTRLFLVVVFFFVW